jgi:hypothetical protein
MRLKKYVYLFVLIPVISCDKGYWQWNLDRENPGDERADIEFTPTVYINCESLSDVTHEKYYFDETLNWSIGSGYENNGWVASNCKGGFVEFNVELSERSILTFWTKTVNPGYMNEIPVVTIDGSVYELTQFAGFENSSDWIRLKTLSIMPGTHVVKIDFPADNSLKSYHLDEIVFFK